MLFRRVVVVAGCRLSLYFGEPGLIEGNAIGVGKLVNRLLDNLCLVKSEPFDKAKQQGLCAASEAGLETVRFPDGAGHAAIVRGQLREGQFFVLQLASRTYAKYNVRTGLQSLYRKSSGVLHP